jgi:type II secretion system protein J
MKELFGFITLERKHNSRVKSSFLTGFTPLDKSIQEGKHHYLTGFTLLELVLSVAITGIVLLTIYSSFSLGLRVWERVRNGIERDAQRIIAQLSRDLRSAYLSAEKNSNLKFVGSTTSINFITVASLRHNFSDSGEYDLREVGYYLGTKPHKNSYSLIYRTDLTPDDNIFKGDQLSELSRQVESLKFAYYDGKSWQKAWNSSEHLPQAVHISLGLKSRSQSSSSEIFSTIVDMPCK